MIKLINIVDDIRMVNYGIWSAAIITNKFLADSYGYECQLWYPVESAPNPLPPMEGTICVGLANTGIGQISQLIKDQSLTPANCIILTHGSWRYATRWGAAFKQKGYRWIYVPQGMLEPWSMNQKRLKKQLYFNLVEKRLASKADLVRAVSSPEQGNLVKMFDGVWLNPNAIDPKHLTNLAAKPSGDRTVVLFMARLHHKKGIIPLVEGWLKSEVLNNPNWELRIAGPDDGELTKMNDILSHNQGANITYLGSVYGDNKRQELQNATFYILPSASEGFPTSVVEAMGAGLIPIISEGCNFPEAVSEGLAIEVKQSSDSVSLALNAALKLDTQRRLALSLACQTFISQAYTTPVIGELQHKKYQSLLGY